MLTDSSLLLSSTPSTSEPATLSLHDALPISIRGAPSRAARVTNLAPPNAGARARICGVRLRRSEEHTSELQSLRHLVCRLLLEKKKKKKRKHLRGSYAV